MSHPSHGLALRRRKQTIFRKRRLEVIKLQDATTQTEPRNDSVDAAEGLQNPEREEEEDEEDEETTLHDKACSICMSDYSETNRIVVGRCGHLICSQCCQRLLDLSAVSFKCPHCRMITPKRNLITINQLSIYSLGVNERKILLGKLEKANKSFLTALEKEIKTMISTERERAEYLKTPLRLSKGQIGKKRAMLLATIVCTEFRASLQKVAILAKKYCKFSCRFVTLLKNPLSTIDIDISKYAHEYLRNLNSN